jgi:sucrose-phosphate synthase
MHVAFVNPQGNFDPDDSYWTAHPDFGGQLVYVKELALAMGNLGHKVDIVTRRIIDPDWPEFASDTDAYPDAPNVRILRIHCGPDEFLPKEELWPYLGTEFVPRVLDLYEREGSLPDAVTAHYGDGGLCAALIEERAGIPFSFTAHSLGAQKMDKMGIPRDSIAQLDARYHFSNRLVAERLAMNRSNVNVTSTSQERFNQYTHNAYRGAVDPSDDARFAAIPSGVALHIFDKSARYEDEGAVQRLVDASLERDLSPGRVGLPCVVASSRLDPKKNHLALVEAFAGSPTLRESANLVILTGSLENPLEDYSAAKDEERAVLDSLMDVIDRAGMRGEVSMFAVRGQRALAAAYRYLAKRRSVFALTALYEPFGLAPLEAMAAGLPAVVTKFGGPSESMREGDEEYGILVDPTPKTWEPVCTPSRATWKSGSAMLGQATAVSSPATPGRERRKATCKRSPAKRATLFKDARKAPRPCTRATRLAWPPRTPPVLPDVCPFPPTSRTPPRAKVSPYRRSTSSITSSTFSRSGRGWSISSRTRWPIHLEPRASSPATSVGSRPTLRCMSPSSGGVRP